MLIENKPSIVVNTQIKSLNYGQFFTDGIGHICVKVKLRGVGNDSVPQNSCAALDCQTDEVNFYSDTYTVKPVDAKLVCL